MHRIFVLLIGYREGNDYGSIFGRGEFSGTDGRYFVHSYPNASFGRRLNIRRKREPKLHTVCSSRHRLVFEISPRLEVQVTTRELISTSHVGSTPNGVSGVCLHVGGFDLG